MNNDILARIVASNTVPSKILNWYPTYSQTINKFVLGRPRPGKNVSQAAGIFFDDLDKRLRSAYSIPKRKKGAHCFNFSIDPDFVELFDMTIRKAVESIRNLKINEKISVDDFIVHWKKILDAEIAHVGGGDNVSLTAKIIVQSELQTELVSEVQSLSVPSRESTISKETVSSYALKVFHNHKQEQVNSSISAKDALVCPDTTGEDHDELMAGEHKGANRPEVVMPIPVKRPVGRPRKISMVEPVETPKVKDEKVRDVFRSDRTKLGADLVGTPVFTLLLDGTRKFGLIASGVDAPIIINEKNKAPVIKRMPFGVILLEEPEAGMTGTLSCISNHLGRSGGADYRIWFFDPHMVNQYRDYVFKISGNIPSFVSGREKIEGLKTRCGQKRIITGMPLTNLVKEEMQEIVNSLNVSKMKMTVKKYALKKKYIFDSEMTPVRIENKSPGKNDEKSKLGDKEKVKNPEIKTSGMSADGCDEKSVDDLMKEINTAKKALKECQGTIDRERESHSNNESISSRILKKALEDVCDQKGRADRAEANLTASREDKNQAEKRFEDANKERVEAQKELKIANESIGSLKDQIGHEKSLILIKNGAIETLQKELEKEKGNVETQTKEVNRLQGELAAEKNEVNRLQGELAVEKNEVNRFQGELVAEKNRGFFGWKKG